MRARLIPFVPRLEVISRLSKAVRVRRAREGWAKKQQSPRRGVYIFSRHPKSGKPGGHPDITPLRD